MSGKTAANSVFQAMDSGPVSPAGHGKEPGEAASLLAMAQDRFRALFDMSADGIVECTLEGVITDVNPAFCALLGCPREWLIGKNYRDITHADSRQFEEDAIARAIREKKEFVRYEKAYVRCDGSPIPIAITSWVARDRNGKARGHISIVRDATEIKKREQCLVQARDVVEAEVLKRTLELKRANQRLMEEIQSRESVQRAWEASEARYQDLVENIGDIIFSTDSGGLVTFANSAVKKILGYEPHEVMGSTVFDLVLPEDREAAMDRFGKTFTRAPQTGEFRVKTKSGPTVWLRCTASPWLDGARIGGLRCTAADITETRGLQKELVRAGRMAAAGQLAAFLAREINSPLQGVASLLSALDQRAAQDSKARHCISLMKEAFDHIRQTVSKLAGLDEGMDETLHAINVNECIVNALDLLEGRLKREGVRPCTRLSSRIPYTMASPQRLEHVFFTLFNHACDSIAKARKGGGNGEIQVTTRRKKDTIMVEVSDNGCPPGKKAAETLCSPNRAWCFPGSGHDGLCAALNIIQEHGARIRAGVSPEGGALYTIEMPIRRVGA